MDPLTVALSSALASALVSFLCFILPRQARLGREWLEARAEARELRERLRWIEGELVSRGIEIDWPHERLITAEDLNGWDHNHAPVS
ncbi:hypothetical protein ACL9RE_15855 [Mycetocola saprophilus]